LEGTGYSNGITSDDILLEAKILALVDVCEAMANHRNYRPERGMEQA
jgi:HD-GYP domain-containing protein (c-di-GMP phosphodiesterase class II)